MTDITQSILAINPQAEFSVDNNDVNKITWFNNTTPISSEDILAKQQELKTAYINNEYQRKRASEYPSIEEQLDKIYHSGITGWKTQIKAIKDKYPKE